MRHTSPCDCLGTSCDLLPRKRRRKGRRRWRREDLLQREEDGQVGDATLTRYGTCLCVHTCGGGGALHVRAAVIGGCLLAAGLYLDCLQLLRDSRS